MDKSNVKVYEQKERKGIPLYVWVGLGMLLLGVALYWANRPQEVAPPATQQHGSVILVPDAPTPTYAACTFGTGSIA